MSFEILCVIEEVIISIPSSPVSEAAVEVDEVVVSEVDNLYLKLWVEESLVKPIPKPNPEELDLMSPFVFSVSWLKISPYNDKCLSKKYGSVTPIL